MPPVTRGQHGPLQVAPRISPEVPRRRNNRTARITLKRNMNGVSKGTTKKFFCKRSQACQRLQDACKSSSFQSLKASEPPRLVNLQSSEHQYGSGGMRVALKSAARPGGCGTTACQIPIRSRRSRQSCQVLSNKFVHVTANLLWRSLSTSL